MKKVLFQWFKCPKIFLRWTLLIWKFWTYICIFEQKLAYPHSVGIRYIKKFHGKIFSLQKFKMEMDWLPWTVGTLWMDPQNSTFQCGSPKCWKNIKGVSKKPYPSIISTWQPTNWHTSRVAKDPWRRERPFATFTRCRVCPTYIFCPLQVVHVQNPKRQRFGGLRQQGQNTWRSAFACLELPICREHIVITLLKSMQALYV